MCGEIQVFGFRALLGIHLLVNAAGTRLGGQDTFLLRGEKVPKETRPATLAR
jgi:hypothetical protein